MTHASINSLPQDLIDAVEAAQVLRVSKGTLYHWIRRGYFAHYRVGRLVRLRASDLAAFLEQERRTSDPYPQDSTTSS